MNAVPVIKSYIGSFGSVDAKNNLWVQEQLLEPLLGVFTIDRWNQALEARAEKDPSTHTAKWLLVSELFADLFRPVLAGTSDAI
jgi:hypothetical protein